jgi:hypothetical protein
LIEFLVEGDARQVGHAGHGEAFVAPGAGIQVELVRHRNMAALMVK